MQRLDERGLFGPRAQVVDGDAGAVAEVFEGDGLEVVIGQSCEAVCYMNETKERSMTDRKWDVPCRFPSTRP